MNNIILKAKDVSKTFYDVKQKVEVLKNVNLNIYSGDFTIIMGQSGSGKSTLLYSLSSMDTPTSGKVEILGTEISTLSEKQISNLRQKDISFIFQGINLIPDLTSFENIAYPAYMIMSKQEANKKSEEILNKLGLAEQRDKYPNEMSGGQQQRIAIARAIVTSPKILFGDEPTGALNSGAGKQVLEILTELNNKGQSIVMVTHDIKVAMRGNRLIYLRDGQIVNELKLEKYVPEQQKIREQKVIDFLKSNDW
ncbi:ABC transporter ATP-binding protein [Romboutsia ilealis]|jgi:putative ABC transport system ATP-binding protein|uniref:ABC transporter ATP-binding protein n=1 Tax=Romboutsia ilealis TaxID=1115758 RepID=UPI000EA055FE|nr:ABC transporter ATP-binding protein [Romboutsia ilealis]MCI9140071.1 ABC transporter ATP-binding protein [Lachnospiraceae bacterium]RKJ31695.1 ABC transporter ATP-binding protein [bacterium 1XD42-8]